MFGMTITLFWGICIYLTGAASILLSMWYWLNFQEVSDQTPVRKLSLQETKLPETISELIQNNESFQRKETCTSINLLLQFFFQERRYDLDITSWLTNLLALEFSEILKHRTLSKIINKMEIQHLNLGNNLPVIKSLMPLNVEFVKNSSLLKNIEISVEIEYTGGFQIIIDAISRLSKKAMIKIKVVRLSGKGCLELSRYPFTHWSFSFYEEPQAEFEVDSSVLGRQIPRFKAIIVNQLKGMLKRKHTLPYYKLRSAPLIKRAPKSNVCLKTQSKESLTANHGMLHVTLIKCSRLQPCLVGAFLYFSLSLTDVPLICAYETAVGVWIVLDVTLTKSASSPIGILLRTADDNSQIIETVSNKSVAFAAGLRKNDIILSVNNVPLVSGAQAAKLLAAFPSRKASRTDANLLLRIKRLVCSDHKRSSLEANTIEYLSFAEDKFGSGGAPFVPPPLVHLPVGGVLPSNEDRRNSVWEGAANNHPASTSQRSAGDKLNTSSPSTPGSSRSNSPDLKLNSMNSCCEEKLNCDFNSEKSFCYSSPVPVPIDSTFNLTIDKKPPSPSSSKVGTPTSAAFELPTQSGAPSSLSASKMEVRIQGKRSPTRSRTFIKHHVTSPIKGTLDPVVDNEFSFVLDELSNYLNVSVWSNQKEPESQSTSSPASPEKTLAAKDVLYKLRRRDVKESDGEKVGRETAKTTPVQSHPNPVTGHPKHVLVGFVTVTVNELIRATKLNTQGSITKILQLEPADSKCPEMSDHPLLSHKGFDPSLCYGDVMISVTHHPFERVESESKTGEKISGLDQTIGDDECGTDGTASEEEDTWSANEEGKQERDHTFKRTHFNAATQCNFCKKKIWLKDAYQCSECGIICHKKCMLRCQQATVCDFGGLRYREIRDPSSKEESKQAPEIIMTTASNDRESKVEVESQPAPPQSPRHTLRSFLSHMGAQPNSMKRVGSAQNLAPPLHGFDSGSRSLPPSPQHTPKPSRKSSLTGNPFTVDDSSEENHLDALLEKLVSWPHDDQLVTLARETSYQLYYHLPAEERMTKIKEELEELQSRVDREGEIRVELAQKEKEAAAADLKDSVHRTKLSLLISECDARTQALALLIMHYFTALQSLQQHPKVNDDS